MLQIRRDVEQSGQKVREEMASVSSVPDEDVREH